MQQRDWIHPYQAKERLNCELHGKYGPNVL